MNSLKAWWSDQEHRNRTLSLAAIVLIFILVLWLGPIIAQR